MESSDVRGSQFARPGGCLGLGLHATLPRRDIETGIASCDTFQGLRGPERVTGGRKPKEEELPQGRLFHKGLPLRPK